MAKLTVTQQDYRDYEYREGDIVYCDPPYAGTDPYDTAFDHEAFLLWAASRPYPVFISEYSMPADLFTPIASRPKHSLLSQKGAGALKTESIYVQRRFASRFMPYDLFSTEEGADR